MSGDDSMFDQQPTITVYITDKYGLVIRLLTPVQLFLTPKTASSLMKNNLSHVII